MIANRESDVELSLVLPSYRGADLIRERVPGLIHYLNQLEISFEVIVVDDGSRDDGDTTRAACELGVKLITLPKNRGKGAAVRAGLVAAVGRSRMFTDVDLPYELNFIAEMHSCLSEGGYDVVLGDRRITRATGHDKTPLFRRATSRVFSWIVERVLIGGSYDTQCGIKGFRDEVVMELSRNSRIDRFAFDVELVLMVQKRNYRIKRIPVNVEYQDVSSVHVISDGVVMLRDLGIIWMNQVRGKYDR